ncbi:MAG: class I SAM-dependent methyltransferase [Gammaproteobacteria bacterium]
MSSEARSYLSAAGHDWLLPFYDPLCKLLRAERPFESRIADADVQSGARVLEIGCGTGNLTLLLKRMHADVEVVGLDPDPKALARARRKAERARLDVRLDQGFSQELPYPDASFDRVLSSFMFHHLDAPTKSATLREVRRVLVPGGSLHLLDFAGHGHGRLAGLFHAPDQLRDNAEDRVLALMKEAGFAHAEPVTRRHMLLGATTTYRAQA